MQTGVNDASMELSPNILTLLNTSNFMINQQKAQQQKWGLVPLVPSERQHNYNDDLFVSHTHIAFTHVAV